jgi:hypothetical protein
MGKIVVSKLVSLSLVQWGPQGTGGGHLLLRGNEAHSHSE